MKGKKERRGGGGVTAEGRIDGQTERRKRDSVTEEGIVKKKVRLG